MVQIITHQGASEGSGDSGIQELPKLCDAKQQKDKRDSKSGQTEATDNKLLPGTPGLSLEITKETAERNCKEISAPANPTKEGGKPIFCN